MVFPDAKDSTQFRELKKMIVTVSMSYPGGETYRSVGRAAGKERRPRRVCDNE